MVTTYLIHFYKNGQLQFTNFFTSKEAAATVIHCWCSDEDGNPFCWVDRYENGTLVKESGKGISRHNAREEF